MHEYCGIDGVPVFCTSSQVAFREQCENGSAIMHNRAGIIVCFVWFCESSDSSLYQRTAGGHVLVWCYVIAYLDYSDKMVSKVIGNGDRYCVCGFRNWRLCYDSTLDISYCKLWVEENFPTRWNYRYADGAADRVCFPELSGTAGKKR